MPDPLLNPADHPSRFPAHLGEALLLFSGVCAALLILSSLFILPQLSRVDIGGEKWASADVLTERSTLGAHVLEQEEQRRTLLLSVDDPLYHALKDDRMQRPSLLSVLDAITHEASQLVEDTTVVRIESIRLSASQKNLVLVGDVHSVGPRSMTVLAQFVHALSTMDGVASVSTPTFQRADDPVIGPHSPFSLTLSLE